MRARIIASTQIRDAFFDASIELGYEPKFGMYDEASQLAEFAGRICYRSWNRPNPETATNAGYIKNLIDHKHFSVLEHGSVTFLIQDVSRNLTHELVRHRHFSFSQVSGRYVDQGNDGFVIPKDVSDIIEGDNKLRDSVLGALGDVECAYKILLQKLKDSGVPKKKAQQAARFLLPGSLRTDIVVTGNHRSWREFIDKRYSEFADPEIRKLAGLILVELKGLEPNIYQDIEEKDFSQTQGVTK